MKRKILLFSLCLMLLVTGCTSGKHSADGGADQDGPVKVGTTIEVEAPAGLSLLDNKDTLAADGMYYAVWGVGDAAPYENSDGNTVDLYDAQLYLLTNECKDEKSAKNKYESLLASARDSYDIQSEDSLTCGGVTFTVVSYRCTGETNPYSRGVSAFGRCGTTAICAEYLCLEDYTEDLETELTAFLNSCDFQAE